ncbi:hypothetical protein ACH4TP_39525 [Streptomyces sp. NPDC021012]|uniref:hypothetical protein n=1 Tax=Streptomyces sp. NPDC021012 TaxID=3365107 RepID=UPI00379BC48F
MRGYEYGGGDRDGGRYDIGTATRLARRAVDAAAPHELPQFRMTAEAFHASPAKDRLWPAHRDEPLGIGLDVVAALISTAALSAAVQVLDHIAQQSTADAVDTTRNRLLPRLFRRRRLRRALVPTEGATEEPTEEPAATPAEAERLTAEQLTLLREVALRAALRWRVPEEQAWAIADGIVAELATLSRERPDAGDRGGEEQGGEGARGEGPAGGGR